MEAVRVGFRQVFPLCWEWERYYRGVSRKCKTGIEGMSRVDRDVGKNVFIVGCLAVQTRRCMN